MAGFKEASSDIASAKVSEVKPVDVPKEIGESKSKFPDIPKEIGEKSKDLPEIPKEIGEENNLQSGRTHEIDGEKHDTDDNKQINVSGTKKTDKPLERIRCINEDLEGKEHSETGVLFEKRQVEVDGKQYEVVAPVFDSKFDAKLPDDAIEKTDSTQFKICNTELKEAVEKDEKLKSQFTNEQLKQIKSGDTPDGYVWHHDVEVGKMQLVDSETHQKTGHTGGRSIWGGGKDNR